MKSRETSCCVAIALIEPCEYLLHLDGAPLTTTRTWNLPSVERISESPTVMLQVRGWVS